MELNHVPLFLVLCTMHQQQPLCSAWGTLGATGGKSTFCWEPGEPGPNALTSVCVWSLSCVLLFVTPWTAARQASLSFTISQFAQIHALTCAPLLSICCLTLCMGGTQSFVQSLSNQMTESMNSSQAERQWLAFKTASESIDQLYAGQRPDDLESPLSGTQASLSGPFP